MLTAEQPVARPRKQDGRLDHRLQILVDDDWYNRAQNQAKRQKLSLAAYIRKSVVAQIEADEATDPDRQDGSRPEE